MHLTSILLNNNSLLSLARSLRQDGGDSLGSRGDMLRGLLSAAGGSGGSGGSSDLLDDADILSALGASSSSNDPLSRIVANINSRTGRDEGGGRGTRATSSGAGGGGGGGGGGGEGKSDKSKLSPIEERTRLYTQMREAERECYELNRRIVSMVQCLYFIYFHIHMLFISHLMLSVH